MKLIKLSEEHYIVVDDSEIKTGDWYYDSNDVESLIPIYQRSQQFADYSGCKKITHSTQPLYKNDFWAIKELKLSEVKELLGAVDVHTKAMSKYSLGEINNEHDFTLGYKQALEDNKEKKYTEEDMRKAYYQGHKSGLGSENGLTFEHTIQSLQPTEWEVEIVDGMLKLKQ